MNNDWIALRYGALGEAFHVLDLVTHIRQSGSDYIIQGQRKCVLAQHKKPHSLDYWLRQHQTSRKDTMQAVNELIEVLVQTGFFVEGKFACPDSGRKCKGLQLVQQRPHPERPAKEHPYVHARHIVPTQ